MAALEKKILKESKRIVIKVGSALIRSDDKRLINEIILNRIVKEIINLNEAGKEILLVSSGALALGKKSLNFKKNNLKVSEKQAASSVGQVLLINAWKKAFLKYKKQCGQILLTHLDAEIRSSAINARNTIESLLKLNSIPIINENDSVATQELRYGDNDQLAARVAQITSSNLLITFIIFLFSERVLISTFLKALINSSAEPSMMGTSSQLISIKALSIPRK